MLRQGFARGLLVIAVPITVLFGLAVGTTHAQDDAKEATAPPASGTEAGTGEEALTPAQKKAAALFRSIKWQESGTADLGTVAEIKLPEGYRFTGTEGGHKFEELTENPPSSGLLLGILTPADSLDWFIVFEYDETGYIRDDEKDKIDANAILSSMRQGTEQSNEFRRSKGWDEIKNINWAYPPAYDATSHNLVWATTYESGGGKGVNYCTRILGRRGVINANLVTSPERLKGDVPGVKGLLAGLEYKSGWRYAEFKSGDKVAAYGLTALITGGAAAVALKTGLFAKLAALLAKLAKPILAGIAGLTALIFGKRKANS